MPGETRQWAAPGACPDCSSRRQGAARERTRSALSKGRYNESVEGACRPVAPRAGVALAPTPLAAASLRASPALQTGRHGVVLLCCLRDDAGHCLVSSDLDAGVGSLGLLGSGARLFMLLCWLHHHFSPTRSTPHEIDGQVAGAATGADCCSCSGAFHRGPREWPSPDEPATRQLLTDVHYVLQQLPRCVLFSGCGHPGPAVRVFRTSGQAAARAPAWDPQGGGRLPPKHMAPTTSNEMHRASNPRERSDAKRYAETRLPSQGHSLVPSSSAGGWLRLRPSITVVSTSALVG